MNMPEHFDPQYRRYWEKTARKFGIYVNDSSFYQSELNYLVHKCLSPNSAHRVYLSAMNCGFITISCNGDGSRITMPKIREWLSSSGIPDYQVMWYIAYRHVILVFKRRDECMLAMLALSDLNPIYSEV